MSSPAEKTGKKPRRKWWVLPAAFLAVLGILVCAGLWYCEFYLLRRPGSGPAGPKVDRAAFARPWGEGKVVLVGIGDSVTEGYGAPPGHSFFNRLADNPPDEFGEMRGICLRAVLPGLETRNLAVSGSTSIQHLDQVRRLKPFPPDTTGIVVVTTGGNDLIHDYGMSPPREGAMYGASIEQASPWVDSFAVRLDSLLGMLRERFPGGCHIFLANIYDPTDGRGDPSSAMPPFMGRSLPDWPDGPAILARYNEVIKACASRYPEVYLVDMHAEFIGHGIHCRKFWRDTYRRDDPYHWYHLNLEDPNDRGYDAIRRLFLIEMSRILPGSLSTRPASV